ncbi:MAG TPA: hypothetical protein VFO10_22810 [Oligoflexus sp.]|uniref:hypothetical protein n=1 Tax=Oligoflexus sp. TaxID=1971216 RepID=UPI002D7FD9DD|nr:hypothetical protein [Oligoflexus sp.]HET9240112.1 hypothetical protein [Oligoflexus sp.]
MREESPNVSTMAVILLMRSTLLAVILLKRLGIVVVIMIMMRDVDDRFHIFQTVKR